MKLDADCNHYAAAGRFEFHANLNEIHAYADNVHIQDENKEQQPCYTGARKMMSSAKKAEIREGICEETNEIPWQKKAQISKKDKK